MVGKIPAEVDQQEAKSTGPESQEDPSKTNVDTTTATTTLLKYQPLENPERLPDFLHEEIEFESTELPPLLQNVLRGIFPEE